MSEKLTNFSIWMNRTTGLSETSIYKYTHAVMSISKEMNKLGIITKSLIDMNTIELDLAIQLIFNNEAFIEKNTRGNNMYSNSLKQFRSYKTTVEEAENVIDTAVDIISKNSNISVTERESLIKSRIGQGSFRALLMEKYNGTCVVTGITINKLLIASHIKPWAVCSNDERLSSENGLLLCANYDKLFDSGLISFDNNQKILISRYIDDLNKKKLHLTEDLIAKTDFSNEMKVNLEYHRDVIFLK